MRSLKSNLLILILGAALIAALWDGCNQRRAVADAVARVTTKDSILTRTIDKLGREKVTLQQRNFTIKELKNSNSAEVATLKKEIGRLRKLKSHTVVKITTTDTVKTVLKDTFLHIRFDTITKDTVIFARRFDYRDKWLKLDGVVLKDSLIAQYSIKNDLSITHHFGKWERNDNNIYISIRNNNPNTTVNQVQTYKIRERKKYPVVSLVAGLVVGGVGGWLISETSK